MTAAIGAGGESFEGGVLGAPSGRSARYARALRLFCAVLLVLCTGCSSTSGQPASPRSSSFRPVFVVLDLRGRGRL